MAKYDKKQKKDIIEPVLRWFDAHSSKARPLSQSSYGALADLLLDPANHWAGLYCFEDESPVTAIRFTAREKVGYIVLHSRIVEIVWDEHTPSALLNKQGAIALQNWIKDNG